MYANRVLVLNCGHRIHARHAFGSPATVICLRCMLRLPVKRIEDAS
jgi:hypothetical protein